MSIKNPETALANDNVQVRLRGQIETEERKFICRICGSRDFREVYKSNGIIGPGGGIWRVHCVCAGCSVIFEDPEKFSKK